MGKQRLVLSKKLLLARAIRGRCWLWQGARTRDGYGKIANGKGGWLLVHRVAAALWYGLDLSSRKNVLHKCDTPNCFNPKHLYIGTQKENVADAVRRQRWKAPRGIRHARARFVDADIIDIREARVKGVRLRQLAERYGTSISAIHAICKRKTWRHV